jgi:tryptophan-rich sensory protein
MFKKYILPLFLSFSITFSAAFIGSVFTSKSITNWYQFLNKPSSFAPPNWLFAPVWTILFLMMAIAVFFSLAKKKCNTNKNCFDFVFFSINSQCFLVGYLFWLS